MDNFVCFKFRDSEAFATILEFLVPAFFALILLPIRTVIKSETKLNDTVFKPFNLDTFDENFLLYKNSTFAYYPNNSDMIVKIMQKVSDETRINSHGIFMLIILFYKTIFGLLEMLKDFKRNMKCSSIWRLTTIIICLG